MQSMAGAQRECQRMALSDDHACADGKSALLLRLFIDETHDRSPAPSSAIFNIDAEPLCGALDGLIRLFCLPARGDLMRDECCRQRRKRRVATSEGCSSKRVSYGAKRNHEAVRKDVKDAFFIFAALFTTASCTA